MDAERRMDVQQGSAGTPGQSAEKPPDQAGQATPFDEAVGLDRLAKILLAVVPR
jgi:hypothetical protein